MYAGEPDRKEELLAAQKEVGEKLSADDIFVVKAELGNLEPTHLYCYQLLVGDIALTDPVRRRTSRSSPSSRLRLGSSQRRSRRR